MELAVTEYFIAIKNDLKTYQTRSFIPCVYSLIFLRVTLTHCSSLERSERAVEPEWVSSYFVLRVTSSEGTAVTITETGARRLGCGPGWPSRCRARGHLARTT